MKSLAEQLFASGLVSEKRFRESQAEIEFNQPKGITITGNRAVVDESELDACTTMQAFKQAAKDILLRNPQAIGFIFPKAHRFKADDQSGKKFIWFFYQVRDKLNTLPPDKQADFLRKAFRRHGSTLEIE